MKERLEFWAEMRHFGDSVGILAQRRGDGARCVAKPVRFEMEEVGDRAIYESTLELGAYAAQSLLDALWSTGMRPTAYKKEPNDVTFAAKDQHITDLRAITFKLLKIGAT